MDCVQNSRLALPTPKSPPARKTKHKKHNPVFFSSSLRECHHYPHLTVQAREICEVVLDAPSPPSSLGPPSPLSTGGRHLHLDDHNSFLTIALSSAYNCQGTFKKCKCYSGSTHQWLPIGFAIISSRPAWPRGGLGSLPPSLPWASQSIFHVLNQTTHLCSLLQRRPAPLRHHLCTSSHLVT